MLRNGSSRSLARLLGGDAWIDPRSSEGVGSIFWFSFTVKRSETQFSALTREVNASGNKRVLLWAPPLITRDVLLANLGALGLQCKAADDCASLIENVESEATGIVVVDTLLTTEKEQNLLQKIVKYVFI